MSRRRPPTSRPGAEASRSAVASAAVTAAVTPPPPVAAARAAATTVLVVESGKTNQKRAEELVHALGYRALVCDEVAAALRHLDGDAPPDVVLCGLPGGEAVARAASGRGKDRPSVVVAVSGDTGEALAACDAVAADVFVLRPYRRDGLATALKAGAALRAERRHAVALESELAAERAKLLRFGEVDPATGFQHFDFFKRLLVTELKRARRYGYSLAACLVALDEGTLAEVSSAGRRTLHAQVARELRAVIRDIDLPVDYADGRFLVFLPYTDLVGAERVGRRLEESVRRGAPVEDDGRAVTASVSVGISALRPGRAVSFAKLVRDASMALRAAQLKGGGRVVVKA